MLANRFSASAALVLSILVMACGGGDDTPTSGDGDIVVSPTVPNAVGAPCQLGATKTCKQTIAELNGIVSCYVGEQTCDDHGGWGPCLKDQEKAAKTP